MIKIKLMGTLLCSFLFISSITNAQSTDTSRVHLAVLPFVSSAGALISNPGDVVSVQDIVTAEFTSLSRFMVLDRSKFQKIIDELHIQTSEQFLNGQIVAQGRQIGAKYLVTGVVNEYRVTHTQHPDLRPGHLGHQVAAYACALKMSFGVIEVETGQSLFTNPITITPNDLGSMMDSSTAANTALSKLKDEVNKQVKMILAGRIQILQVGQLEKDGSPKTVLTNGGGDMFKQGDHTKLTVSTSEAVGNLVRTTPIATLTHPKVESQIVEWEVNKKEAKILADALAKKTPLILTVDNSKSLFSF